MSHKCKLKFSEHVAYIVKKCNTRLYQLRKLKQLGLGTNGLLQFYITVLRSVIHVVYACPAWQSLLSKTDFNKLDQVQRRVTRIILPDIESYSARLEFLR